MFVTVAFTVNNNAARPSVPCVSLCGTDCCLLLSISDTSLAQLASVSTEANLACLLCYVNVAVTLRAPMCSAHLAEKVPPKSLQQPATSDQLRVQTHVNLTRLLKLLTFRKLYSSAGEFGHHLRRTLKANFLTNSWDGNFFNFVIRVLSY